MAVHNEMFVLFPLPFTAFMSVGTDVIIKPHSIYSRIREHCGIGRGAETGEFIHRDFMIRTWNNPDMAYEIFCRRRTECSGISVRVRKAGDMKKTTKAKMIIAAFLAAVMFLSACGASAPGGSQKQGSQETETQKPKMASLLELIDSTTVTTFLNDADITNSLHYVRILGMNAKHGRSVRKKEAKLAFENIAYLVGLLAAKESGRLGMAHHAIFESRTNRKRVLKAINLVKNQVVIGVLQKITHHVSFITEFTERNS